MTKPIGREEFAIDRRGLRTPGTLLTIHCRDELLRAARRRFFQSVSDREAARLLHHGLRRYAGGPWRRERAQLTMPSQRRGRIEGEYWLILCVRDAVPGFTTIRNALAIHWPREQSSSN